MKYAALAIAAVIFAAPFVSAAPFNLGYGDHDIEISIPINQHAAYAIQVRPGDKLMVNLEVAEGGPVDFFFTNSTAYEMYLECISGSSNENSLFFIDEYSKKEAGVISYTYNSLVANDIVVLIDNTGFNLDGVDPLGTVEIAGTIALERNVWTPQNIALTIIAIATIITIMVGIKYPRRKP